MGESEGEGANGKIRCRSSEASDGRVAIYVYFHRKNESKVGRALNTVSKNREGEI